MSLHHLSPDDRALLRAAAERAEVRQRDDDDPQQGRGVIVWAFGAFLVALAIAVAVL